MLTNEQFDRTRRWAKRYLGIGMSERHRELLARRTQRLGLGRHETLESILDAAEADDELAVGRMVRLVTTHHTGFFRHLYHFDLAAEHALWTMHRGRPARLWSAAVSTGEEAYSLAIALLEVFRCENPATTILATDVDQEALTIGRRGEYREAALGGLTPGQRSHYFSPTNPPGSYRVAPAVRRLVEFRGLNLVAARWEVQGPFDVIFCRNVLMYLEAPYQAAVLERLSALLNPGGLLLLDPVEHLGPVHHRFSVVADGVHALRPIRHPMRKGDPPAELARRRS